MKSARLIPLAMALLMVISCSRKSRFEEAWSEIPGNNGGGGNGGNTQTDPPIPTSGLTGTIQYTRTPTNFRELAAADALETEWAEGEAIVLKYDNVDDALARKAIQEAGGFIDPDKNHRHYYLVESNPIKQELEKQVRIALKDWDERGELSDTSYQAFQKIRRESQAFVQSFRTKPDLFAKVAPNYIRRPSADDKQWAIGETNLPDVWGVHGRGSGNVWVAVVDTGVRKSHPNLTGALLWNQGFDFVNDQLDGDTDPGPDANPDEPSTSNSSFHGTHVSGIVAAAPGNGEAVEGVAKNVRIMPVRVLGEEGGTDFDIAQGILYAAGLLDVYVGEMKRPTRKADIINLSLGGAAESPILQDAIQRATDNGSIVIAAAGNEETSQPTYPAAYPEVIAVGSHGVNGKYSTYSNYGPNVDIMAPGENIWSTWVRPAPAPDDEPIATYMSGTSMAAPFVAGVAALMKSVNPALSLADMRKLLFENAESSTLSGCKGTWGQNYCGRGALDLPTLLAKSKETSSAAGAKIDLAKDWLIGTPESSTVTLRIPNNGSGTLALVAGEPYFPTGQPIWISEAIATAANNEIVVKCTLDLTRLGNEPAAVTMNIATNASEISVAGQNGGAVSQSGILKITLGYEPNDLIHVVLVDPTNQLPVAWINTSASKTWKYAFDPPAPGEYLIFAGSDKDQNGSICSVGDACGAYPSLSSPQTVSLSASELIQELDFDVQESTQEGLELSLSRAASKGEPK